MKRLSDWIKKRPLWAYFVLAYALSWLVLAPLLIAGSTASLVRTILGILSDFGPPLAAVIVVGVLEEKDGLRAWLTRIFRWRVKPAWYLAALLVPVVLVYLGYGFYLLLRGTPLKSYEIPPPLLFLVTLLFIMFLGGGQEEPGWRGFALPRLQERFGALGASMLLGVIWAFWHTPKFFIPGTIQSETPMLWYLLLAPAVTTLLTWIFNSAKGSVLPAMLLHAGINTAPGLIPLDRPGGLVSMRWAVLIAIWLMVAVLVLVYRPEKLSGKSRITW